MPKPTLVRAFVSNTPEYHDAFTTFLAHTDQKENAFAWIGREVANLPARDTLIDAGAGTGKLTAWLLPSFRRVVAVEPNPSLVDELKVACPTAEILSSEILDAPVDAKADFILCSHVFYYIPRPEWEANLHRLISWLTFSGVLVITIQNPETDCMRMVRHFIGGRLDLGELCKTASDLKTGRDFEVRVETVPAHIETKDLDAACQVAEFILNVLPMPSPPPWHDLERYVEEHFRQPGGGYRYSCHQDFLRAARRA